MYTLNLLKKKGKITFFFFFFRFGTENFEIYYQKKFKILIVN